MCISHSIISSKSLLARNLFYHSSSTPPRSALPISTLYSSTFSLTNINHKYISCQVRIIHPPSPFFSPSCKIYTSFNFIPLQRYAVSMCMLALITQMHLSHQLILSFLIDTPLPIVVWLLTQEAKPNIHNPITHTLHFFPSLQSPNPQAMQFQMHINQTWTIRPP